jgi:[ribosomal protein S5]-alanine N-acetyltransferase
MTLRAVRLDDVDALHRLWTHPDVRRFFWDDEVIPLGRAEDAVREAIGGFDRYGFGLWVAERDDGALIGFCGLRHLDEGPGVEVLYGVAPPEWGRGLATEMAAAMLRYGFDRVGLPRIIGVADAANTASRRVLEKSSMTFDRYSLNEGREEAVYSIRPTSKS